MTNRQATRWYRVRFFSRAGRGQVHTAVVSAVNKDQAIAIAAQQMVSRMTVNMTVTVEREDR